MADIYVDTAGSNTSPYDTEAKAATTLAAALLVAATGDIVKVVAGITTVEGSEIPTVDSKAVTIEKYGVGANPIISKTGAINAILYSSGSGQLTVSDITFDGLGAGGGVLIRNTAGTTAHSFTRCIFRNAVGDGLRVTCNNAAAIISVIATDCVFSNNGDDGSKIENDVGGSATITCTRCVFYGHDVGSSSDGFSLHADTSAILNDCDIYDNENGVSNVGGTTCTINGGEIHDNLNVGIRAASGTATFNIYGCHIYDNAAVQPEFPGAQIASTTVLTSTILTMEGCVVSGTPIGKWGVKAWGAESTTSIKNCTFTGAGGGVWIGVDNGAATIIGNSIFDFNLDGTSLFFADAGDVDNITISYSVFNKSVANASNEDISAISTNAGMQFEATIGFLTEGNYRIGYASPCIGTGIANSNNYLHPLTNFGDSRSYLVSEPSLNDIGAFKYIGNDGLR